MAKKQPATKPAPRFALPKFEPTKTKPKGVTSTDSMMRAEVLRRFPSAAKKK